MFFDLSIPFVDLAANGESTTKTLIHRRSVARAMELGYSGVAYDRQFRGVMSDSDRCRITHLSLDSLVSVSPALISSASFHRGLLGAPKSSPFRQYTRITVSVDRLSVGTAFNAKSVLRSYDLVAARPGDQEGFNQACKVSEVDIIALDFPLKFRLKLPMVEAAIKRGVHFEITYSNLISDDQRNKMLSDARLLVDWTRGKNLILSSSAASVNEIRGPYDILNLASFLLGLSMERAKSAISANCRSLIGNALRKKDYKEAIRIERMPEKQLDWLKEWKDWDPISSGEHDLSPLDDKLEPFSTPSKLPKSFSAIDFLSCGTGFSLKDQVYGLREDLPRISNKETAVAAAMKIPCANACEVAQGDEHKKIPVEGLILVDQTPLELQISHCGSDLVPPNSNPSLTAGSEEGSLAVDVDGNLQNATRNTMLSNATELRSLDIQYERCTFEHEVNLAPLIDSGPKHVVSVINLEQPMEDPDKSDCANIVPDMVGNQKVVRESVDCISNVADCLSTSSYTFFPTPLDIEAPILQIISVVEGEQKERELSSGIPMNVDFVRPPNEEREESGPLPDDVTRPSDEMKERDKRVEWGSAAGEMAEPLLPKTGKRKRKARSSYPAYPLPFKSLLKPTLSKKRACQSRKPHNHLHGLPQADASALLGYVSDDDIHNFS